MIDFLYLFVRQQIFCAPLHDDLTHLQHVSVRGNVQNKKDVLFNEQEVASHLKIQALE